MTYRRIVSYDVFRLPAVSLDGSTRVCLTGTARREVVRTSAFRAVHGGVGYRVAPNPHEHLIPSRSPADWGSVLYREVTMPRGRHRPKPLFITHTWEYDRTQYTKPSRWAWLTKWIRR